MKVDVVESGKLNFDDFVRLHRSSFTSVLDDNRSAEIQNAEHFRWKYTLPQGQARVAVVYDGGQMVAANSMVPMPVRFSDGVRMAWQSCDTATHPVARGKGLFSACIKALADSLELGEIFYGFPNGNSIRGFEKLGWKEAGVVSAYCCALPLGVLGSYKKTTIELNRFEEEERTFLDRYNSLKRPTLEKTVDYLNWRYFSPPQKVYSCFAIRKGGKTQGLMALRTVKTGKLKFTLIMELLALDSKVTRTLLGFASTWGMKNRAWPVATLQTDFSAWGGAGAGYVLIPHQILPKRHVLMGMVKGQKESIFSEPWRVQTGDWDGF